MGWVAFNRPREKLDVYAETLVCEVLLRSKLLKAGYETIRYNAVLSEQNRLFPEKYRVVMLLEA
jgi:hypothetical protein